MNGAEAIMELDQKLLACTGLGWTASSTPHACPALQSVRDAINQIELLDRALKARADVEEIRQLTDTLGAGIRRTADLLQTAEAEAR